jgi:hypothetical protein
MSIRDAFHRIEEYSREDLDKVKVSIRSQVLIEFKECDWIVYQLVHQIRE